jgi:large subunit ribosomal protein L21
MAAIIKTGGKQYRVNEGDIIRVEKLKVPEGEKVVFNEVLGISTAEGFQVGTPFVKGASVEGKVLKHGKAKKIIVFKYKAKKDYRNKQGHRQPFSQVQIEKILLGGKTTKAEAETAAAAVKAEEKPKAAPAKETAAKTATAAKTTAAKKPAAAKPAAEKKTTAAKPAAEKKTTAAKSTTAKTAEKKPAAKSTTAKTAEKKPAAKSTAAKTTAAKSTAAKKTTAASAEKKPAAKKAEKPAEKKTDAEK